MVAIEESGTDQRRTDSRAREAAARIRAARNYAGLTQQELADRMKLSLATIKRMESGVRPISTDELLHVGICTDFPAPFMLRGKAAINGMAIESDEASSIDPGCRARFGDIEDRLARLEDRLRRLGADE